MLIIQRKAKRKWAFSNMMAVIRYHLTTYIDLFKFLKDPGGDWRDLTSLDLAQLALFPT